MTVLPLGAAEIEQLGDAGYFVRPEWLGKDLASSVRAGAHALSGFAPAGIGRGSERHADLNIRGDELRWMTREEAPAAWLGALETLKAELNEGAYLGLGDVELQCARYLEPGAHYARHRDSFRGRSGRRLTCIYYLNEGWLPEHGGALRLHLSGRTLEVEPRMDTLVVFLSEELEHEVTPSFAERWALTAWFSGPTR